MGRARSRAAGTPRAVEAQRRALCVEAARVMAEEGVLDYQAAKRKAGERLNLSPGGWLPSNREVDDALGDYLATFRPRQTAEGLRLRLRLAREAMAALAEFAPRAVGAWVRGRVTPHTPVELHLFADSFEEVNLHLMDRGIRARVGEKRLRYDRGRTAQQPCCRFEVEGVEMELVVFNRRGERQAPLCPVSGQPMARWYPHQLAAAAGLAEG